VRSPPPPRRLWPKMPKPAIKARFMISSLWINNCGARKRPREANVPAMPGRKQFKTNNLQRAAMRRGVSFANENPARVCDGLSSGGVSGTLVGGFGGGRDCGAAEIQRVLKMLPRWPDMNTSHSSSGPVTAAAWPSDKGHRETGEWRRSRADMHRRRATDAKHRAAQATELSIKSAFVGLAACRLLLAEQMEWIDRERSVPSRQIIAESVYR